MEYNDFREPSEESLCKMREEYSKRAKVVEVLAQPGAVSEGSAGNYARGINWERNDQILRNLVERAPNRCIQNYLAELLNLSRLDNEDFATFYPEGRGNRQNPRLERVGLNSFSLAVREYIKSELELLASLTRIAILEGRGDVRDAILNIFNRRIEALGVLAGFFGG